jgi:hypothetical protein
MENKIFMVSFTDLRRTSRASGSIGGTPKQKNDIGVELTIKRRWRNNGRMARWSAAFQEGPAAPVGH